jgi:PhnB protein
MLKISIYLNFKGTTHEAFKFYQSVFGGEFQMFQRMKDIPGMEKLSAADQEMVMHIALPVGSAMVLHGTDAIESMGHHLTVGNNVHLMLEPDTREEADRYYKALSEGGTDLQPMREEFWGAYYGAFTDKFGIRWMMNCDLKK